MEKNIEIRLSEEDLEALKELDVICEESDKVYGNSVSNAGLARSLHWLANCDCAMLSAWRDGQTRKVKDDNNKELQLKLRSYGYGVSKVVGFYAEVGKQIEKENSFLVFDLKKQAVEFFNRIFELSSHYNQDSFLYKRAGQSEPAYIIGTNEDFGLNKREMVGYLRIGAAGATNFSRIGSKDISFD